MGNILDKTAILDRIKAFYGLEKKIDLANFLNIPSNTLSNWYSRGTLDMDVVFTKCVGMDYNWLLSGEELKKSHNVRDRKSVV